MYIIFIKPTVIFSGAKNARFFFSENILMVLDKNDSQGF